MLCVDTVQAVTLLYSIYYRCQTVGIKTEGGGGLPEAMLTLDMWLPPSYVIDSWDVLDSGQLGPATR